MEITLKNRTAILTGAGGGIGRATALKLAEAGVKLILLGGKNTAKLEETGKLVSEYTSCIMLPGDLTDTDFLAGAVKKAAEYTGVIDILINNAGIAANASFEDITLTEFDRIMAINVRTPFFLMQQTLPYLKKSQAGSIINIASVVAHAGYPMQSPYVASKHALLGLTKSVAAEYYRDNIRVHVISPGGVYTDMVKLTRPDLQPDGMIMPEDIAETVYFLLANRTNAVIDEILLHRAGKEPFLV